MTTVDLITALFYEVDEQLHAIPKHPEAHLWPSEVVTLGLLHALKGGGQSPLLSHVQGVRLNYPIFARVEYLLRYEARLRYDAVGPRDDRRCIMVIAIQQMRPDSPGFSRLPRI